MRWRWRLGRCRGRGDRREGGTEFAHPDGLFGLHAHIYPEFYTCFGFILRTDSDWKVFDSGRVLRCCQPWIWRCFVGLCINTVYSL